MDIGTFIRKANHYGKKRIPFLFLVDFEMREPFLAPLSDIREEDILYSVRGRSNTRSGRTSNAAAPDFTPFPVNRKKYSEAFNIVLENIREGNSYLLNLTFPTEINSGLSLRDFFHTAEAPYKLFFKNRFTLFSPECFVRTENGMIYTYPMKGTIDAAVPDAETKLLSNRKELWEHHTIVDLLRNDLAMISRNVTVTKFRFIEKIRTNRTDLLQASSEIRGELPDNWQNDIGRMMIKLLPAGSVSGAPKQKTVEIIRRAEGRERGYFTGIFGIFDGKEIDSAVNIRFIERINGKLRFRSGGGITAYSDMNEEYEEMVKKVYVPAG